MQFGRHRRRMGLGLLVAAVTLLVAATPTVALASRVASLHSAAKSTINLEQINLQSLPGVWDDSGALQAYFSYVNAHGGVDGHKINMTECYAGTLLASSPNQATTCAQQAVSNHVLALVGDFNDFDSNILPIVAPAHIADFGDFPLSQIDNTSKDSYPLLTGSALFASGVGTMLVQEGHCKVVGTIVISGTPTETTVVNAVSSGVKFAGGKVVSPVLVAATETDFAPAVATLESEGANCIADELGTTGGVALATAVSQSGEHVIIGSTGPAYSPAAISALGPLANGILLDQTAQELAQVTDAGYHTPGEKLFYQIMQQYDPGNIPLGNSEWPCYESAAASVLVLKYMVSHGISLTPANFQKAIPKVNLVTGFFAPVSFASNGPVKSLPRDHAVSVNYLQVENDTIVPITHRNYNAALALVKYPNG
jgi:ABC-type branched-subunit amino acid transport system substrate-binding protein